MIIRDATYWIPLLVMLIGSRVEELLRLKKGGLQRRNKVDCLAIGFTADEQVKTSDSVRFVPIPQVLLDLGFADWIRSLPGDANALLFPEAAARSSKGKISDAFGKHLRLVFSHLGVADFDEDFYALRKTLLSNLSDADVPDNQRKAIAGHRQPDIINRHYTAHRTKTIRASLDRIDHGLTVEFSADHGFPVIRGCDLGEDTELVTASAELDEAGQVAVIEVRAAATEEVLLSAVIEGHDAKAAGRVGAMVMPRHEVAAAYNRVTASATVRLPRNAMARAAIEHLAALSTPALEADPPSRRIEGSGMGHGPRTASLPSDLFRRSPSVEEAVAA